jgi:tRNA nucleotidyltransferase (CCA-adding enzyme)
MASRANDLRTGLEALPGMDFLLPTLAELDEAFYLVGGAVRDLLRGKSTVDLDVAVEGDAVQAAAALAERLGGSAVQHERFGTATVRSPALTVDLATTRRETYSQPGALPTVEPAPLAEDLRRRDFSVNAMAIGLSGADLGRLHDPTDGHEDLEARIIRVLHPASFLDDPTRLLRAVRYESRLGFRLDPDTEDLARQAAAADALSTVSGARIRDELLDLLAEHETPRSVGRLADLGLDSALHPALRADPEVVASAKLGAIETGADPVLAALAALCLPGEKDVRPGLESWVASLDLSASARDAVLRASARAPTLANELRSPLCASELRDLLEAEPPESLALALALGAPPDPVLHYLADLRSARLEISGADLLAAGVPQSPALGHALRETLRRKLDGEISGREEELRAAIGIARRAG